MDAVVRRALDLVADGAGALDVGAQSAITGREPAHPDIEAAAVVPVVRALADACPGVLLSVDTFKPPVVAAVLDAGAHLINDVSGLRDPATARLCARRAPGWSSCTPRPRRSSAARSPACTGGSGRRWPPSWRRGSPRRSRPASNPDALVVDPGVDFTKTPAQTVELLRDSGRSSASAARSCWPCPGRTLGALTSRAPAARDAGTLGAVAALRHVPDQILRVHDVAGTVDMLRVLDASRIGDGAGRPGAGRGPAAPASYLTPVQAARSRGVDRAAQGSTRPR